MISALKNSNFTAKYKIYFQMEKPRVAVIREYRFRD